MKKLILLGAMVCVLGYASASSTRDMGEIVDNNPFLYSTSMISGESWSIANIYYAEEVPYDTKAIDSYNTLTSIQYILKPCKLQDGEYKVTISKVSSTLVKVEEKIDGKVIYLEMKGDKLFGPFSLTNPKPEVKLVVSYNGLICSIEYKGIMDN